jgi:hypothetical protein
MRLRSVVLMGALWALTVIGFQLVVSARYAPERPDRVLSWTAAETGARSHDQQPYLLEPFLHQLTAWDSEFYLSISTRGYDDPAVRSVEVGGKRLSLDYAFFPAAADAKLDPATLGRLVVHVTRVRSYF